MTKTIGKIAKELDINIETIRFYERRGLIQQPLKPNVGYRHYPDETISRVRFIKRTQQLGFTLEEIANFLGLNDRPCIQIQDSVEHKLNAVKDKMEDLQRLETVLNDLLEQCHSNDDESHCPIFNSLQR